MAFNLQTNMNAAARAKADQANRKAAQRIQSETVEADMGFDMPIMGVSVPAVLPLSINREQCNAAQVLGQRSQSQNLNNVGKTSTVLFRRSFNTNKKFVYSFRSQEMMSSEHQRWVLPLLQLI
mmetsp:Transcript_27081/g.54100  ORF Transcript_27081/g.54100 Transcript_27081/m.54100 type:complete len:123 (-) Transcript_27081:2202-2570(-)